MTAVNDNNGTEPGLQSDPSDFYWVNVRPHPWAIILAGGAGSRLAGCLSGKPKQFLEYKNAPLYWQSAKTLSRLPFMGGLIFVFPEEYMALEEERIRQLSLRDNLGLPWLIAPGGKSRSESSRNGLRLLPASCLEVFIHDAARPFLSPDLVMRLYNSMDAKYAAAVPGLALVDTVKTVDEDNLVTDTPPRRLLRIVQTPQLFKAPLLKRVYETSAELSESLTDDASLLEKAGYPVLLVEGDSRNVKITNPEDLALLREEQTCMLPCSGFGYDVHRYGEGHPLKLGGVEIPCPFKVVAHSDGDTLLHALVDAILGCGGLGDIGSHFPDSDPAWSGISSSVFVEHALSLLAEKKIMLTHLDLTIVAQKPRLSVWKREIAKNVARLCNLDLEQVNIKATTEEGLGFSGRLEGIKAYALASAIRKKN